MSDDLESWYRDRSLDQGDGAGAFAIAVALLRLTASLDRVAEVFRPPGKSSFEIDHGLVSLAHRVDNVARQLGPERLRAVAETLIRAHQQGERSGVLTDPPEAREFGDGIGGASGEMRTRPRRRPPGSDHARLSRHV